MKPETAAQLNGHDGRRRAGRHRHGRRRSRAITVAGKTGTAETGEQARLHAWFIFFAPAENPTVAGAVVLEHQLNGFGGTVAGPIAKQLMQALLPQASKP